MFKLDREIEKILAAAAAHRAGLPAAGRDDWRALRAAGHAAMATWAIKAPAASRGR